MIKKNLTLIFCIILFACETGSYINIEIKNFASEDIIIEGFQKCDKLKNGQLSCSDLKGNLYQDNKSEVFGISSLALGSRVGMSANSHYVMGQNINTESVARFPKFGHIKIYYKSKSCPIFEYFYDDIYSLYTDSALNNKVLSLTYNGLRNLSQDEYMQDKDKYQINDKNVKCMK